MKTATLQNRLTTATRAAVFASPRLAQEYRRRHQWRWAQQVAKYAFAILGLMFLMGLGIASWHVPDEERMPNSERAHQAFLVMMMLFTGLTGLLASLFSAGRALAWIQPNQWPSRAYLPHDDEPLSREIAAGAIGCGLGFGTFFALLAVWFIMALVPTGQLSVWHSLAIPLFILVSMVHCFLLALFGSVNLPERGLHPVWIGGLMLLSLLLPLSVIGYSQWLANAPLWQERVKLALFMIPTAWPLGAFEYAILKHQPLGWLFLLPVGGLALWCAWWIKRGVVVREFRVTSTGACFPIFERGFNNGPTLHEVGQPRMKPPVSMPVGEARASAEQTARKRILREGALTRDPWQNGWWVERFVTFWLTPRERKVAWHICGVRHAWSLTSLGFALLTLLFAVPLFGTAWNAQETDVAVIAGGWTLFLALVLVLELVCCAGRGRPQEATVSLCHPLFPLRFDELSTLLLKTYWLRMLCLAPLLLALAGGTALLSPTPWQTLASIALLLSTVATAGVLQLVCFLCAARSRFTWDPRRFAILMLAAGNFFGWFLLPLVVLVSLPFALLTSGGYLALAGLIWLCFRRHYHNQMDFMDPAYLRTR